MKPSILAVFACVLSHLCLHGAERAFVESSRSQIVYDANGVVVSSADFQFVYDQHGNHVRDVSSDFLGAKYLGYDLNYYATNAFVPGLPGAPYSIIHDSVALSNGIPYETVHAITTNSWATNQSTSFTDQITTYPDGHFDEMITTIVDQTSPDSHRVLTEVTDTSGRLLSWALDASTNDPVRHVLFTLLESGGNNETAPDFIEKVTYTFDAFGEVLLLTSESSGFGYTSLTVTSNSYVRGQDGRVLAFISKVDYGGDGTNDSTALSSFTYNTAGNLIEETNKWYAGDGSFQGELVASYTWDRFGNLLHQETKQYEPNGSVITTSVVSDTYVPRGQSFDRPAGLRKALGRIQGRLKIRENAAM